MGGSAAEQLRAAVLARRDQLKFSRRQVSLNGGPSEPTLLKIERGQGDDLGAATFRKLDIGLQWEAGSAARVVEGGTPTAAARSAIAFAPGGLVVPVSAVAEACRRAAGLGRYHPRRLSAGTVRSPICGDQTDLRLLCHQRAGNEPPFFPWWVGRDFAASRAVPRRADTNRRG